MIRYMVVNRNTGKEYGPYATRQRARSALDRKDNAYGCYAHYIKPIEG